MAAARILFPDFREEQRGTKYPFNDTATLTATDGITSIQKDTFIDASFYIINGGQKVFISSVIVAPQLITIWLSDEIEENIAYTSFAPSPLSAPGNEALTLQDGLGRPAGALIVRGFNLALFAGWTIGTYEFDITATEFVSTTVIPTREPGVRGLKRGASTLLTDDVWLIGDGGVTFRYMGEQDGAHIIRVDITGVPLFTRFLCVPFNRFVPRNFVRTINSCPPDEYGNFTITATGQDADDTVLRITQDKDVIFIDAVGRKVV